MIHLLCPVPACVAQDKKLVLDRDVMIGLCMCDALLLQYPNGMMGKSRSSRGWVGGWLCIMEGRGWCQVGGESPRLDMMSLSLSSYDVATMGGLGDVPYPSYMSVLSVR